ncbi:tetratricopeptide repeat protein [Psychroserpens algicola]|uniref:Tetratricopeptide repeat protein n=1 Tax=Psychroserpens algicola TaxID=1719034 RepID=A0ABT0H5E7_9FLAO|nr:tetratricopeptide repeat protein [Psychroserpens algicola]MCK8479614.1 tetratricopeptide repeat protein [Psychroserpens algicola]
MKTSTKLLFLLVAISNTIFAQNDRKADSLLNVIKTSQIDTVKASTLLSLAKVYQYKNPIETLNYSKKALSIYKNEHHFKGQSEAFGFISSYYNSVGKMDSAMFYTRKGIKASLLAKDTLKSATHTSNLAYFLFATGNYKKGIATTDSLLPIFKRFNKNSSIAKLYTYKSQYYNMQGYTNLSLDVTYEALDIYKALNDSTNIAACSMLIGNVYQGEGSHEKAIEAFKEALAVYETSDNKIFLAQAKSYIGDSYLGLGNYSEAETYLNEGLELSKQLNFNPNIGRSYLNIGRLKVAQKKYDEAIKHFTEGLNSYKSINIPYNETRAQYHLGEAYYKKAHYNKAIDHLNTSISISDRINDPARKMDALLLKSLAYEALGDSKNALTSFRANKKISDSLFNVENLRKTEELQIQYETEKKEQQIKLQNNQIELLETKDKMSNLKILLLGFGLLLTLFIIYAIYQRAKRHKVEKENAQAELEYKTKELTTHALHLAKKNEVLNDLKQKAKVLKADANADPGYQMLIQTINFDLQDDNNWENFSRYFEQVHKDFNSKAQEQFPNITKNDLRLMALLKMNLSSKEIANILNISSDGIKKARQRLRRKMGLDSKESLENTVMSI